MIDVDGAESSRAIHVQSGGILCRAIYVWDREWPQPLLSSSQLRRAREAINVLSSLSGKLIRNLTPLSAAMQGSSHVY